MHLYCIIKRCRLRKCFNFNRNLLKRLEILNNCGCEYCHSEHQQIFIRNYLESFLKFSETPNTVGFWKLWVFGKVADQNSDTFNENVYIPFDLKSFWIRIHVEFHFLQFHLSYLKIVQPLISSSTQLISQLTFGIYSAITPNSNQ